MRNATSRMARLIARVGKPLRWAVVALTLGALAASPVYAGHLVVRTSDIVNGAVTAPKIRNGAVPTVKLRDGAVSAPKLRNIVTRRQTVQVNANNRTSFAVECGPGEVLISGGGHVELTDPFATAITESRKEIGERHMWVVTAWNTDGQPVNLTVEAYCLRG